MRSNAYCGNLLWQSSITLQTPVAHPRRRDRGLTRISRDAAGRPVAIDDGRGKREVSYNRFGYPTEIKDEGWRC